MKKNIWIIDQHSEPPDGQWCYTFDLMQIMVKRGYRVTFFVSSVSHYLRKEMRLKGKQKYSEEFFDGIKFVFVKTNIYKHNNWRRILNVILYSFRTYLYAKKLKEEPDIIIGGWPPPFGSMVAFLLAQKKNSSFFFEVMDLWPIFLIEKGLIGQKSIPAKILRYMETFCAQKSDKIISFWPRMDLYFETLGIPREKTLWLPMGVNFDNIQIPIFPLKRKQFTAMYRGGLGYTSDLETILYAAKYLLEKKETNIKFVLVCEGPLRKGLEELKEKLNISNVTFNNFCPREHILKDIERADLLIGSLANVPNFGKYGMISSKLLEYLAANRPIVYATNDMQHMVVRANAGITVEPANPKALAEAVLSIYNMTIKDRERLASNGLAYLKKYHDLDNLADKLEKTIEEFHSVPRLE